MEKFRTGDLEDQAAYTLPHQPGNPQVVKMRVILIVEAIFILTYFYLHRGWDYFNNLCNNPYATPFYCI